MTLITRKGAEGYSYITQIGTGEMLSDGSYVKDNSDHAEPLDSHTYLHHYFEKPFELPPAKLSLKERLFGRFHKN